MDAWVWVVIVGAALVVVALVAWPVVRKRRTVQLQERFGPEYERTVRERGDRRSAEAELEERRERRSQLEVRPLSSAASRRYAEEWRAVQSRFVDEPVAAVGDADRIVTEVMRERGYPMDDFDRQAEVISVDHPHVVEDYREGHAIYRAYDRGDASTEDLRQAMVHYRSLFDELLESEESGDGNRE